MKRELRRQTVHASGIVLIVIVILLGRETATAIAGSVLVVLALYAEYRLYFKTRESLTKYNLTKRAQGFLERHIKGYERPLEGLKGPITYFFGCFITLLLFETRAAIVAIAVLALADAASTLVGRPFGRHLTPINKNKTWEGSIAFFLVALIVVSYFDPVRAFGVAVGATVMEMLPFFDDNITIPIVTAILMSV